MIKLNRRDKPEILEANAETWLRALDSAIAAYGSYRDIPDAEKVKLVSHYRHEEIKRDLFSSSFEKCAFCECKPAEGGNIEVEHFKPKSLFPRHTFDWDNFLPACRKCNGFKQDHDTVAEPIVNPYDIDPEAVFFYSDIRIVAANAQCYEIARRTIDVCGLNSARLYKPRAEILIGLHGFSEALEIAIDDYNNADTQRKKNGRIRNIREALERIELLARPEERYSGYCKNYLKNCDPYHKAKGIVEGAAVE